MKLIVVLYPNSRKTSPMMYGAEGNKETLLEIQKKLTPDSTCPFDLTIIENPDSQDHDVLGYINEVYNPIPNYLRKYVESTGEGGADFKLCYTICARRITLDVQK